MSPPILVLLGVLVFVGSTLLLSELRWFRRRPLVERLSPYVAGGSTVRRRSAVLSAASFGQVVGPLARAVGERVARAFGVTESLAVRLERVHSPRGTAALTTRCAT